jgi:hypothetical protein
MTIYRTNKPIETKAFLMRGSVESWTIPEGSRVHLIKDGMGVRRDAYALSDIAMIKRLSGNVFDPTYRYLFVDLVDLEPVTAESRA